jgi:hypothetical protein
LPSLCVAARICGSTAEAIKELDLAVLAMHGDNADTIVDSSQYDYLDVIQMRIQVRMQILGGSHSAAYACLFVATVMAVQLSWYCQCLVVPMPIFLDAVAVAADLQAALDPRAHEADRPVVGRGGVLGVRLGA